MSDGKQLFYIPQLDSLRAIAVILVLMAHWLPTDNHWNNYSGRFGVAIFFVLSGFLISRILYRDKEQIDEKRLTLVEALKSFYIKRSLRIFPAYFAVMATVYLLHFYITFHLEGSWYYYLLYISNFYIYQEGHWIGILNHTWSLAVEEQFYLVWPFVILFTQSNYRLAVLIITITLSLFFGIFMYSTGNSNGFVHVLTPSCMGSFAIGAIVAHLSLKPGGITKAQLYVFYALAILSVFFLVNKQSAFNLELIQPEWLYFSLPSGAILLAILLYKDGFIIKGFFSNRLLLNLGKISYGIYLYHAPIAYIWENTFLSALGFYFPYSYYSQRIVWLFLTILIAKLSWKYIESPALGIKSRVLN